MSLSDRREQTLGTRNERWGRLGLLAASLFVAAFAAEVLVRIMGWAPEIAFIETGRFRLSANPKIGYEPRPLDYDGDELTHFDYRGASNSLGYRGRDHALTKPESTYRIVLIGDSIGAGLKIDRYADTFPAIAESSLREAGWNAELINFSVSGYNTQQEVETLKEKGLAYDPDLVLLQFCLNDFYLDDGYILGTLLDQQMSGEGIPSVQLGPVFMKSALLRLLRQRLKPYVQPTVADLAPYQKEVAENTVAESLRELAALSRDHDFDVHVVVFPAFKSFDPYAYHREHQHTHRVLDEAGLPWTDLLETMMECAGPRGEPLGYDIFHPTERGHRCAGEAIAQILLDRESS